MAPSIERNGVTRPEEKQQDRSEKKRRGSDGLRFVGNLSLDLPLCKESASKTVEEEQDRNG